MNSMKFMENRVEKSYSYLRADHHVYKMIYSLNIKNVNNAFLDGEETWSPDGLFKPRREKVALGTVIDAVGKTISEILHCAFFTHMYVINAFSSQSLCLNSFGGVFHTTAYSASRVPLDNFIFLWQFFRVYGPLFILLINLRI